MINKSSNSNATKFGKHSNDETKAGKFNKKRKYEDRHADNKGVKKTTKFTKHDNYELLLSKLCTNVQLQAKHNVNLINVLEDILKGQYSEHVQPAPVFSVNRTKPMILRQFEMDQANTIAEYLQEFEEMNEEAVLSHIQGMYVEYETRIRAADLEDKKFLALSKKIEDEKTAYESNKLYICSELKELLDEKLLNHLLSITDAKDIYVGSVKTASGWINDPLKLLNKLKQLMQGVDIAVTQSAEELAELRTRHRIAYDRAQQGDRQLLSEYILYFDKVINNLQSSYGTDFARIFPDKDVVVRFIKSLHDKSASDFYVTNSRLGTANWPTNYEDAKTKARGFDQAKMHKYNGSTGSNMVFGVLPSKRAEVNDNKRRHDNANVKCWNCNEMGHYSNRCPEQKHKKQKKHESGESVHFVSQRIDKEYEFIFMVNENGETVCNTNHQPLLMLDNGSTVHIYCDRNLVYDIRSATEDTFNTAAGPFTVNMIAKCKVTNHDVWYAPDSGVNILSFALLKNHGYTIEYNNDCDEFKVVLGGLNLIFERYGNLYKHAVNADSYEKLYGIYPDNVVHDVMLTKKDQTRMKRAATALHNANISPDQLDEVVRTNVWKDSDEIDRKDIENCVEVFGRDPAWQRGRSRLLHNVSLKRERNIAEHKRVKVYFDIMFLFNQPYFVFVTDQGSCSLLMTRHMQNTSTAAILDNIIIAKNMLSARKWEIEIAYSDSQSGVSKEILATIGVIGEQLPAKTKIGEIEVQVRLLKERIRSILSNLKCTLPLIWVKYAVTAATIQLNCVPKYLDGSWTTAREHYYGVKPSLLDIEKLCFGDYVEVTNTEKTNDVNLRTRPGIALYPILDGSRTWCIMMLDTKMDIKSRSYTKLQITEDVIRLVNDYGRNNKSIGGAIIAEQVLYTQFFAEVEQQLLELKMLDDSVYQIAQCHHISYRRGIQLFGEEEVGKSVRKEVYELVDQDVWMAVDYAIRADATSFLFLKDKLDKETGKRIKLKCRHVISQMDSTDAQGFYDDIETRSPTPSWNVTTLLLSEAAERGYHSRVMDVPAAFLWAANPYGHVVILDEVTTMYALERRPEWQKYVRNGKLKVRLMRNQYGTKEAGKLWHELISKFLLDAGYAKNIIEPCLFTKQHSEDVDDKTAIVVYVDDLLVISRCEAGVDAVQELLTNRFGAGLVVSQPGAYDYLGLRISHDRQCQTIYLDGNTYVEETLTDIANSDFDAPKWYESPSSSDLFTLNDKSELLSQEHKARFHSIVAKLMWIAMRVRLDILLPVCYLATKVHNPRHHELGKLRRVIGYLKFKPTVRLALKGDELFGNAGTLNVWVDAAHAVHKPSMRSHIGVFASAGRGPILLKSIGAKRQTNSSTGSEIYALSYAVGLICGLVNFMRSYGVNLKKIVVHEDNQAVLNLVRNDKPMNDSSKHMEVQRLFIKERINEHAMDVRYCATDVMIADVLTKSLSGKPFNTLVLMMGIEGENVEKSRKRRRTVKFNDNK